MRCEKEYIWKLWNESRSYKKKVDIFPSFLWILRHPLMTLRLLHFAFKVILSYGIIEDEFWRKQV
ncbi:hypothetical protein DRO54_04190 [Candidatus Bathyarchaeota archaeon]|nr:MAG: hypothetical protein DRO54_04190 [Candidatus Bathyarchaeota archaeon]